MDLELGLMGVHRGVCYSSDAEQAYLFVVFGVG